MISLTKEDKIGIITLDNQKDNKITYPDFINISILKSFIEENYLKSILIKGAGRHFSSGADLSKIKKYLEENSLNTKLNEGKKVLQYIYRLNIPVVAAIEGVCFGAGLEIALAAHIRVVSKKALLAFPESMHNLMPGLSGSYSLKKHLSLGQSIETVLSGNILNAEQSLKLGIADYCVPAKSTFEYSVAMLKKLTKDKPLNVINNIMTALKNAYELDNNEALIEETRLFCELARNIK